MQHPDEGTIHAWLDGQLPRDEAAAIEAHVAECRQCADAVAEARGLIAASSRILMALDSVPRGVTPKQTEPASGPVAAEPTVTAPTPNAVIDLAARAATAAPRRGPRRWLSGPSLAAAAAVVLAVGSFAVVRGVNDKRSYLAEVSPTASGPADNSAASGPAAPTPAPAPVVPPSLGSGARVPSVVPRAAVGSPQLAAADQAERAQSQQAQDGRKESAFAPAVAGSVAGAKAVPLEEKKAESELARVAQDRAAPSDSAARRALADLVTSRDSALAKKPDTTTVAIIRSAQVQRGVAQAAPAPTAPPATAPASITIRGSNSLSMSAAETGAIRGRVIDGNGTGLSGAMVQIVGTSTGTTTDSTGQFRLVGVPPGSVQLQSRRLGYEEDRRAIAVVAGQTAEADVIMRPAAVSLSAVVVTGAAAASERRAMGSSVTRAPARTDSEPGAAMTAIGSRAIGCYELGITTSSSQARTALRQVPRRIALDGEIVPANADGIWYRARDLSPTAPVRDGLWRPVGVDGVEIEWLYGSKLARIRLTGPPPVMMRGTVDEIDRSAGTNEAGSVVSSRRACR